MNIRLFAALMAATALAACGFDSTPQSSGSTGSSSTAASIPPAQADEKDESKDGPGKTSEAGKKAD